MVDTPTPAPVQAIVEVKSTFLSKINWTQVVSMGASLLVLATGGKVNLTPEDQAQIIAVIGIISGVVTIVIKTFFTSTITPSSVPPPSGGG